MMYTILALPVENCCGCILKSRQHCNKKLLQSPPHKRRLLGGPWAMGLADGSAVEVMDDDSNIWCNC